MVQQVPEVTITNETFMRLQRHARPLVDTVDSVISRLLDLADASGGLPVHEQALQRRERERASVGQILPEHEYFVPILQALVERGGEAPAVDVIDRVGELLAGRLTKPDYEELRTGGMRWKKRTQFARFKMVGQGLLRRDSPRGVWAVTPTGRKMLESAAAR